MGQWMEVLFMHQQGGGEEMMLAAIISDELV